MTAAVFSASPEVLLERYGVSAHRVFGSTPVPGGNLVSSRGHSASSLGNRPRPPATAPPLTGERHWAGSHSAGSLCSSARSAFDLDKPRSPAEMVRCGSAGGALSSASVPSASLSGGVVDSREVRALSLGELRAIVGTAPGRNAVPPAPSSGKRLHRSRAQTADTARSKNPASRDGAVRGTREDRRLARGPGGPRKARSSRKEFSERQPSTEDAPGSGEGEFEFDLHDDDVEEDGVENRVVNLGKARQKKGKPGAHFNPFVEFEDREQRLMCERRWLKDDDFYMRERLRGMRLDSVQARLDKVSLSGDQLYQDSVYFSGYACGLRARQSEKADLRRTSAPLPAVRSRGSVPATGISVEAEHHVKNKKGQGDKTVPTKEAMSLKNMQAELKESIRAPLESIRGAEYFR